MVSRNHSPRRLMPAWWRGAGSEPPRRARQAPLQLDSLEGRMVLSRFGGVGGAMAARMAATQVASATGESTGLAAMCTETETDTSTTTTMPSDTTATTPTATTLRSRGRGGRGIVQDAELAAHLEQLRTDVNAVLAGSAVTDAQRLALRTDLRSIAEAGFRIDKAALATVIDSLLTTLADGTYDSDATVAQANIDAFNALFTDSGVEQSLIDQTYADIVAVARNLNISTEELNTLAADRAAIQADLERLGIDSTRGFSQSNADLVLNGISGGFGRRRGRGRF